MNGLMIINVKHSQEIVDHERILRNCLVKNFILQSKVIRN